MTNLVINMSGLPKQQYLSWKGENNSDNRNHNTISAVPVNSAPPTGENARGSGFRNLRRPIASRYNARAAPNPIKHWRKQLIPSQGVKSSSRVVGVSQVMDRPGGSNHLVNQQEDSACINCSHNMINYISKDSESTFNYCFEKSTNCLDKNGKKIVISNPARVRRSASTVVKKEYYTTSKAYLKNRVKLYNQNQTLSNTNPQEAPMFDTRSTNCCDGSNNTVKVYYKPNNPGYSKEGAVTSSNRIAKLKYDTIQNQNEQNKCCNDNSTFGLSQNALQYRGNAEAPYYLKSKIQTPIEYKCHNQRSIDGRQPSGGSGVHTVCFQTKSYDVVHKKGTLLSSQIGPGTGKLITPQLTNAEILKLCENQEENKYLINMLKLKYPCELGNGIKRWNTQEKNGRPCDKINCY